LVPAYKELHGSVGVVFYRISDTSRGDRGAEIIHSLMRGELDLVVAPSGRKDAMLRERQLYRWNLRVVLHDLDSNRSKPRLNSRDLKEYKFLVAPTGHRSREIFDELATRSNVRPNIFMESSDQNVLSQVARHEPGCAAIVPDDSFGLPDPNIGPVLTEAEKLNARQGYSLYYRKELPGDAPPVKQRKRLIGSLAAWIIQELTKPA
jgi:DNA-binding transcriptional LysR family regulator